MFRLEEKFKKNLTKVTLWINLINIDKINKRKDIMARIKIDDLPQDMKISHEELKKVIGGVQFSSLGNIAPIAFGGQSGFGGSLSRQKSWLNQGNIWMG